MHLMEVSSGNNCLVNWNRSGRDFSKRKMLKILRKCKGSFFQLHTMLTNCCSNSDIGHGNSVFLLLASEFPNNSGK